MHRKIRRWFPLLHHNIFCSYFPLIFSCSPPHILGFPDVPESISNVHDPNSIDSTPIFMTFIDDDKMFVELNHEHDHDRGHNNLKMSFV